MLKLEFLRTRGMSDGSFEPNKPSAVGPNSKSLDKSLTQEPAAISEKPRRHFNLPMSSTRDTEKTLTPSMGWSRRDTIRDERGIADIISEETEDDCVPDPFMVHFKLHDQRDPRQWSELYKWFILTIAILSQWWANVISAMFASGVDGVALEFDVTTTVARVAQASYLIGFAFGPIFTAPLSEDYGRVPVHALCLFGLGIFQIPCALAKNIGTLITFRFITGCFGAATFNSIGMVADMWSPEQQGWAVNAYALFAELGSVSAPVWSGYLYVNLGWRWIFGISGIVCGFLLAIFMIFVPETRGGVLLEREAKRLRKETGDDRWFAQHERTRSEHTLASWSKEVLVRPLFMLFTEPIVWSFALFDSMNYAVTYLALEAVPLVYVQHGFDTGAQGLPFIALNVGFLIGFAMYPFQIYLYRQEQRKSVNGQVAPEALLLWSLYLSLFFPVSLFWFAWTIQPSIHWIVSVLAFALFALSSHVIFMVVSEYTAAAYSIYAASAIAAQSVTREFIAGGATLFAVPLYKGLGYNWASTLLAFCALGLAVVPYILYWYGPLIRARSSFATSIAEAEQAAKRDQRRLLRLAQLDLIAEQQREQPRTTGVDADEDGDAERTVANSSRSSCKIRHQDDGSRSSSLTRAAIIEKVENDA